MFIPVQAALCPQQEGVVQLDGASRQEHCIIGVDRQLSVQDAAGGYHCREALRAVDHTVDQNAGVLL